ncbi:nicotinate-nucleotide pyrophosphorylase [carboxylating] [Halohasta litchfieldiae]|jgi:nicotinate-nucleotide pyrophosphorylase (carboxylating)|uniref:Nicotinate-nucleotide pyrophosphorylase [carboxylating] n=1 Tax=Halohasta litchfieldiae TaxID=1073996 RepID=A0A1H6VXH7_9EURY|nr:carboxylating nicotinate-nucleotide diphosphorylase [Halohasta litchfieldiae]ATW89397.1 nicotinate-nucleotide pyrophosphorylase [carboxylating] [Halohasta litchfieldiae]SEJ05320.1 nicotinate-nucleotide pyrophosphorylase [carboxylating] [Halohasta litchfieldiae]
MLTSDQIEGWLREDVGHHDVTNDVPGETTGRLVAKESGVAAGIEAAAAVFEYLDVTTETPVSDGDRIEAGDILLRTTGTARETLRAERVAVNLAGHASGIATKTRQAVDRAEEVGSDVRIAGTRKTTPGLRGIEKRAVVAGGGDTHRLDLSHMVMIKDNHIAELGLETAVSQFRERVSFATKIEVEAESAVQAKRAVDAGADIVLLDNFPPTELSDVVDSLSGSIDNADRKVLIEASGGITVDTVTDYAATGVDIISMGSLTHSAETLDYSFRTN